MPALCHGALGAPSGTDQDSVEPGFSPAYLTPNHSQYHPAAAPLANAKSRT